MAFERKETMALDRSALQKCVSRFPGELGRLPYGNFIGVTYAQFERVGILRTLLPKAAVALRYRHAKGLASQGEQIASTFKVAEDRAPIRGWKGGPVREHEQIRVCQRRRVAQAIDADKSRILSKGLRQRTACNGFAGDGRKSFLPEDHSLCEQRRAATAK